MKTYMIVTNDEFEIPVKHDLKGAVQVAEYLGLSVNRVRKNLCTGIWNHKSEYKAVVDESVIVDSLERRREYSKKYSMTHDRTEYYRQHWLRKKERESGG